MFLLNSPSEIGRSHTLWLHLNSYVRATFRKGTLKKLWPNAHAALSDLVQDGMTLAVGGFGLCGIPENLILALRALARRNLVIVSNNAGIDDWGLGLLLQERQICKMVSSYIGENREFERQYLAGEVELELCPQGTLAERLRAGGAGIPAFYTPTGVGTLVADGKDHREFVGRTYILERSIQADISLVKAWKADNAGNLVYRKTARNFNPEVAACGTVTIAEVEELVNVGEIDPDNVHTPGIYITRVVLCPSQQKRIERRIVRGTV